MTLTGSSEMEKLKPINWLEIVSLLWRTRKLIAVVVASVTMLSMIASLVLPEYYRSTTTLLPETEQNKLAALGGLSDLAALAGVNVGAEASVAKLYPIIIKSETVLKNVIYAKYHTLKLDHEVDLIQYWGVEEKTPERSYQVTLRILRDEVGTSVDLKTNVVTLDIETREPQLSADILNNITGELDKFFRTKKITNAGEQRRFIEGRLAEVKRDLQESENALREFREKNRQISTSPRLMLEEGRLIREVQMNTTIYTELKKQFEIARIEEIKNISIINVMDNATPQVLKERPKRLMMVMSGLMTSLIMVVAFVIGRHYWTTEILDFITEVRSRSKQRNY